MKSLAMKSLAMNTRHGASLVELIVVMSAATVVLTMSASLIHRIMHAQSRARAFADVERTSLRLANAFRRDVHDATVAKLAETDLGERVFLRLALPDNQTIEYGRREANIVRVLLEGSRTVAREEFAFPAGIELAVRRDEARLIVLTIQSRPGEMPAEDGGSEASAFAVPVNLQVQAALKRRDAMNQREFSIIDVGGVPVAGTAGAILIAALVCLAIVMGLLGQHAGQRDQNGPAIARRARSAAVRIAAGGRRGSGRCCAWPTEPDYRGETWRLPAAEMIAGGDGVVTIEVALDSTQQPWPFSVSAEYPAGGERSIRRSRTILLSSKPQLE